MIRRYVYDEIDSTNLEAFRLAEAILEQTDKENEGGADGAPFLVLAKKQTDGRGRVGRTWQSEEGGLFFSLYLRPNVEADKASMLTIIMAVAVEKAIKRYLSEYVVWEVGGKCEIAIKWPNDILLNKKKIVGILTTLQMDPGGTDGGYGVVVGVGVNTNQKTFSEDLLDKATSVYNEIGISILDEILLKYIEEYFMQAYTTFEQDGSLAFLKDAYEALLVNKGREVRVLDPAGEYQALAQGINDSGHLLVTKEDGRTCEVYAGEVSVRGIYGYVD